MSEYWSRRFAQEGMIWGSEPSPTAYMARDLFRQDKASRVLVPGAGYGRNTKIFSQEFETYGIELSQAALDIGVEWDPDSHFLYGSALDHQLDVPVVDAIYCYDVLHLFLEDDRKRLIANCLEQLRPGGLLYFTCFSDQDLNNGRGRVLESGTFEYKPDKYAHFFSEEDLRAHFAGTEILETGVCSENLRSQENGAHQYILRYIISRAKSKCEFE